jgi:hypothetical protein
MAQIPPDKPDNITPNIRCDIEVASTSPMNEKPNEESRENKARYLPFATPVNNNKTPPITK